MVKVCDAIMGSGKTEAAIAFINENPERRFIYAAPYLEEADRIIRGCQSSGLKKPMALWENGMSKVECSASYIKQGYNIATTHQALSRYTKEMVELIREQHYTLIIDEAVNILTPVGCSFSDMKILERAGVVRIEDENRIVLVEDEYAGGGLDEVFRILRRREVLVFNDDAEKPVMYYWAFPKDVLEVFDDVYVLTYLFEGQMMKYYLDLIGVQYKKIGISFSGYGDYHFNEEVEVDYIPCYVQDLRNKIHILDNEKMNNIGGRYKEKYALSINWFRKSRENCEMVRKNIYNYVRNIQGAKSSDVMWGTFSAFKKDLKGKGYSNGFVVFNERSKNCYSDKTILAYCANVFLNPSQRRYLELSGKKIDQDLYSLSTMIQWIWRSAIRNGEDITVYIPSKRMRNLLVKWIDDVADEAAAHTKKMERGDVGAAFEQQTLS